jgi:hypothetical protein
MIGIGEVEFKIYASHKAGDILSLLKTLQWMPGEIMGTW